MKIAIHNREGSFSERWIKFCLKNELDHILVNCYATNIIDLLKSENVTHLMWHINHSSFQDLMVFPYVLNSADKLGIKTFPNFATRWHFDDKVAQKYLMETIGAPLVKSNVFYDRDEAISYLKGQQLPIVTKLKRGAGSTNVKLISSLEEGEQYITKLFTDGIISTAKPLGNLKQKYRIARKIKSPFKLYSKILSHLKKTKKEVSLSSPEKGYVYFQEFMANNSFDTRIIVIGKKAFGIRRFNNDNDFRASGSGKIDYSCNHIDKNMIEIAFKVTKQLEAQCLAYDFIYDTAGEIKIVELCFGFSVLAYDKCEGFWTEDLTFYKGNFVPQDFMMEDFISE